MLREPRRLSQFTADEQRTAIALAERYGAYLKRKKELGKITQDAGSCLAARPHVEALLKRPALAACAAAALLQQEQAAFFQEQLTIIQTAREEENGTLATEWTALAPLVDQHQEALEAVRTFLKESGSHAPVVYDDMVWGEALIAGIYDLEKVVERELAETREFLSQHNPTALNSWPFRRAASYIDEGEDGGCSVYEVADKYREFRATFARLRAEAVKPAE